MHSLPRGTGCRPPPPPKHCRSTHPSPLHPPTGSNLTVILQQPHGCAMQTWPCCLTLLLLTSLASQNISWQMHFAIVKTHGKVFFLTLFRERHRSFIKRVTLSQKTLYLSKSRFVCTNTHEQRGASRDTGRWPAMPSSLWTWLLSGQAWWSPVQGTRERQSPTDWPQSNFGKYGNVS